MVAILCGLDFEWVMGDYQMGDVIIFNGQTVHKAMPNQLDHRLQSSCDSRYQYVEERTIDLAMHFTRDN